MVSKWSFAFTRKSLKDVFKEVLRTSSGGRLKKTSSSLSFQTSLRPKIRRSYDVFATSLCRLGIKRMPSLSDTRLNKEEFLSIIYVTLFFLQKPVKLDPKLVPLKVFIIYYVLIVLIVFKIYHNTVMIYNTKNQKNNTK